MVLTPQTPAETFANLNLVAAVTSVTIASPPVVNFTLKTNEGVPVVGFGSKAQTAAQTIGSYPNLAFALAKLVPSAGGAPSKWVSYIVTSVSQTNGAVTLGRPSTDNIGTLVDNKDGSYTYTFYRDVPGIKAQVDGITPPAGSNKADLGDLTYEPNLTHRLTIQIYGNAPGTGTNTPNGVQVVPGVPLRGPVDVVYDFVPATGLAPAAGANRKMVAPENCDSCHSTLGGIPGDSPESSGAGFHGGSRNNVEYCTVCHTEQRKFGQTEIANCGSQAAGAACYDPTTLTWVAGTSATTGAISTRVVDGRAIGNLPNFVHKTHLGGTLARTGYYYAGVAFDTGGYSQDIRNCEKCHDPANPKTPQAIQWKEVPSRLACGSCHDGINFDTGVGVTLADAAKGLTTSTGFFGKAHPDNAADGTCSNASCHGPVNGVSRIDMSHRPVTPPNPGNSLLLGGTNSNTNSAWIASNTARLPDGAIKVEWDVKSVSLNASRNPVMVFRWLQNGTAVALNTFGPGAVNPATGLPEMWPNFMGSPSAYFVWSEPQDGIAAPVDFNKTASAYLRNVWNGTVLPAVATLTGPDASGYYTATLTGTVLPATARMFTGGMGYSYNAQSTQPLTQTNLAAYPVTAATNPLYLGTNKAGGLIVIASNKQLTPTAGCQGTDYGCTSTGGFIARRAIVEDKRCNACHQELGTFTEDAFHAGQRNDGTTCSWCHTPNRASSGWTAETDNMVHAIHGAAKRRDDYVWHAVSATDNFSKIVYPGILARCEQCHLPGSYDFANAASANAVGLGSVDQIDKRQYRLVASGATLDPLSISISPYVKPLLPADFGAVGAGTNLVLSPTVAACVGCHDSELARSHMVVNGGSFYEARSTAILKTEQCFVCHSSGKIADTKSAHAR